MILDSSVLVDIDRGSEKYEKIPSGRHAISSATYMELTVGRELSDSDTSKFGKLRENLEIIPIDEEVAEKAGELMAQLKKEGDRVELNDIYIAATALVVGEKVLTGNSEHFERVDDLEVIDWNRIGD